MKNPLLQQWEDKLNDIFEEIDKKLEKEYGDAHPLKPGRPKAGEGITHDTDGLFEIGVLFTPGFTSSYGPGYVFRVRLATFNKVPPEEIKMYEDKVARMLEEKLPEAFPEKDLRVVRDGKMYKIIGDLGLN